MAWPLPCLKGSRARAAPYKTAPRSVSLLSRSKSPAWTQSSSWPWLAGWSPNPDLVSCVLGFLQRTNSLEEKSRLVSAFKERQSSKNLFSRENSDRDTHFRRAETDFSNLFARGGATPSPWSYCEPAGSLFECLDIFLKYFLNQEMSLLSVNFHEIALLTLEYNRFLPSLLRVSIFLGDR